MNIVNGSLVGIIQKGDLVFVESFEAWYDREHDRMVATVLLATGSFDLASESVDEACARALERWTRVVAMDSPTGWVYRVALNHARRITRRHKVEERLTRRFTPEPDLPASAGEIWELVRGLSDRQRQVIMLRHVAELPEREIAEVLGISRGTVSSTLHDAHQRLGRLLGAENES